MENPTISPQRGKFSSMNPAVRSNPIPGRMEDKPYRWVTSLPGGSHPNSLLHAELFQQSNAELFKQSNVALHGSLYFALMSDWPSSHKYVLRIFESDWVVFRFSAKKRWSIVLPLIMVTTSDSPHIRMLPPCGRKIESTASHQCHKRNTADESIEVEFGGKAAVSYMHILLCITKWHLI
jgi:hypothetical protein